MGTEPRSTAHRKALFKSMRDCGSTESLLQSSPPIASLHSLSGNELHQCVLTGDKKRLKKALSNKKRARKWLDEVDEQNMTPLLLCMTTEDVEMLDLFIKFYEKNKIDINARDKAGSTVLHTAVIVASDLCLVRLLKMETLQIDVENLERTTPLHYFCKGFSYPNCQEPFELMIQRGARVNLQNNHGETPLHKAIFNPTVRMMMVELLLQCGADVNLRTNRGDTALHFAVNLGREDLVTILLRHNADVNIKERSGKTPMDIAKEWNHKSIEKRLRNVLELERWLDDLGMSQYKPLFLQEELYKDVLVDVNAELLERLGITVAGHRMKIVQACQALKEALMLSGNFPASFASSHSSESLVEEMGKISGFQDSWVIDRKELEFTLRIGSGSSGKVYKGILREKIPVAIKVLRELTDERMLSEFKKEVEIMQYGDTFLGPQLCMVMEYCGRSLFHIMNDPNLQFGWDLVLKFMNQMCQAMDVLHSHNPPIVHRDMKSLNLLITDDWILKMCDFGLSRFASPDNMDTLMKLRGTPVYCAPEVILGKQFSAKSDVYGMGIVFWEMIYRCIMGSYERPFAEYPELIFDFQIMVQAAQRGTRPTVPAGCPKALVHLLHEVLDSDPAKRPSCREMVLRIEELERDYRANPAEWEKRKMTSAPGHSKPPESDSSNDYYEEI